MAQKTINLHGHNYQVMTHSYAKRAYDRFCDSSDVELSDVYGRYSRAKENAYEYCRSRERECNSYTGVICSYNTCEFTYGFTCWENGVEYFVYITKSHDYAIALEDF